MTVPAMPDAARRAFLGRLGMALAAGVCGSPLLAQSSREVRFGNIERDIDTTLARCNALAPHARTAFGAAVGGLVFPTLVATGIPGELAGDGALRVAQAVTGHYLLSAFPAQPGPERVHSLIFLFMAFDALSRFQRAPVWPAGEANFAVPLLGPGGALDPRSRGAAVLAIALGQQRLLPALTLKDLRITPLVL